MGCPPLSPAAPSPAPLTAMLIATALAVVVLTPRTRAGSAWAQTLVESFDNRAQPQRLAHGER